MKLRTEIEIQKGSVTIDHQSKVLMLGSCFTENIGDKLIHHKFNALSNPLGISYNPISLHQLLTNKIDDRLQIEENDGIYYHHQYHSSFNSQDISQLIYSS